MLPIEKYLPEITSKLQQGQSLVLQAEPGAGKSTAVPLSLLKANILNGKKIIMLEPRRVAVKSIAFYLAKLLGEKVGQRIGYQIRNERKTSQDTILEIVTEGVLTRRLQNDPELSGVGLIIFDEFHERSIHADLALMLSLEVQEAYREDLKLLVMSATIDTEQISRYLGQAPIMRCPGRTYPVEVEYLGRTKTHLSVQVMKALSSLLENDMDGDILVFLPGQADIKRCMQSAQEQYHSNIEFLPLYGGLPLPQQELVLSKKVNNHRRVIFSTNIAETSLTIEGITCVIDSGLEKVLSFDIKSGLSRLETSYISKASATQRAGRAGRLQSGRCIRLWSETEHNAFSDFQADEITTSNLASLTLDLSAWGITTFEAVNWLTAPPKYHFEVACELNYALGLFGSNNKISQRGLKALKLGLEPRLASMLLSCDTQNEKQVSCILAALLSERDIIVNADSSDVIERVLIFNDYLKNRKSFKASHKVNFGALEQAITLAKSFARLTGVSNLGDSIALSDLQAYVGPLLLKAYPERLAQVRGKGTSRYLLANGRGVTLRESDSIQGEPWLVVCDCDGKNKDGLVFVSAAISIEDVKNALKQQLSEATHYSLDSKKEKVTGRRQLSYKSLVVEDNILSSIPKEEFELCIKDILSEEGLKFLNWSDKCDSWFSRAKWLSGIVEDFPSISEVSLINQLDCWLLPYISNVKSIKQLRKLNIYDLLIANFSWDQQQLLAEQAPEYYITPSKKRVAVRYDQHQGPTVAVILQEMFGQLESPLLAQNKVPLRFELLSPARRPIQTTSDLGNFWKSSYFDVAKDMRGKYPKHRWPEKPLEEVPGRSIKRTSNYRG
ncbi:ATP-dependent helicase HrpB [Psychrobium sp. 1_MG-2023]|uniref:ATP-dependent helicase HrpB n=1 Tax=Psychrobium sp. 1_MG-2023 TaxID=3062624 RepID=UPI000C332870|nr:ATP-dependent helicase HrpB [Psychrobium sp. 1_MG-2023]MDP2562136.1 ATP-dependent helicase HrpB [Psychrobium sp. 1_MG-2023]PKF57187.1 ATP-dependent helicase HrpB [Alteromonadales bacterium alter-6D02]